MKTFFSFIIAVVAYVVLGLIAWNVVCSNIDVLSKTIVELADYKLYTYSAITYLIMCILPQFSYSHIDNDYYWGIFIWIAINCGIAIATNHWEDMWESVGTIFTILYNIVNVFLITMVVRNLFEKK